MDWEALRLAAAREVESATRAEEVDEEGERRRLEGEIRAQRKLMLSMQAAAAREVGARVGGANARCRERAPPASCLPTAEAQRYPMTDSESAILFARVVRFSRYRAQLRAHEVMCTSPGQRVLQSMRTFVPLGSWLGRLVFALAGTAVECHVGWQLALGSRESDHRLQSYHDIMISNASIL